MSQFPDLDLYTENFDYAYPSMLNAEAMPFTPVVSQRSPLRPSAPAFVVPVARMITPHSLVERDSETPDYQHFFQADHEGNDGGMSPALTGASDHNTEPFNLGAANGGMSYGNVNQASAQIGNHQDAVADWVLRQPEHAELPESNSAPDDEPECFYDAYVVGEHNVIPTIEREFDLDLLPAPMTPDSMPLMYRQSANSRNLDESLQNRSGHATTEHDSDADGDYETDDDYHHPGSAVSELDHIGRTRHTTPKFRKGHKELSISDKQKKAALVIKQQANENSLAKRLGQDIRVVRKGNRVCFEGVYWKAPENDHTIPVTEAVKYACVQEIISAFRNNKDCKEVATSKMFLNRWGEGASHYTTEELESAAWDIVDTMIAIHTVGWTKKLLDQKLRDQVQKTMFCTFGERFEALVKLLTGSKRTCEDLLKSERFYTTIGNPFELEVRTSSNMSSNKRKGAVLKRDADEGKGGEAAARAPKRAKKANA